jgi:hypothetical protein
MPLPECPAGMSLRYTMFTRSNRNAGQAVTDTSVPSVYSPSRRTVFIAHGWNTNGNANWMHDMKNAFLDREDINAVIVDWGGGAIKANYAQAASNTRTAGAHTARVFGRLLDVSGSSNGRMWCTGHSLGSHMCGHTGMRMPATRRLGRVTGMDPAGPLFEGSDKTVGINQSSGQFVDILHTDSRGIGALGVLRDVGHIDFYPSGGSGQPGCFLNEPFSDELWDSDDEVGLRDSCSHSRAYQFMTESVKRDCFHATQRCNNYTNMPGSCSTCGGCGNFPCAYMGYAADSSCNRSGLYYLTVRSAVPYCVN